MNALNNFNTYHFIIPKTNNKYQLAHIISLSKTLPQSIEQLKLPTTIQAPYLIVNKPTINVKLTKFKAMFHSCVQRHNITYNMYSPPIKIFSPLAMALQTNGNIRLPLVLPIINGDYQNHGNKTKLIFKIKKLKIFFYFCDKKKYLLVFNKIF